MSTWSIVVPEAGHNLVTNPSLENNTTGYSPAGGGGTIARDTSDQRRGVACLKVMPAANGSDGCYYAITLTAENTYAFSFDFKGKAGVPYRACLYDLVTLSVLGQQITFTGDDRWHRYEGVATNGTHTNVCILITKNGDPSTDPFYLDCMQVEQADHATTYIDGDQDGCTWLGPAHAAASERSAQYRLGGRVWDIDSLASGITVQSFTGAGMPPVVNLTQDRALLPGKTYCGTKVAERVLQLLILANGSSLENWHHLRKTLIDVVKPDAVSPQQPFLLRYGGAGPTVEIPVVYGGGLEQGEKSGFAEAIVLRLIAYDDPYWYEEGEAAQSLSVMQSLTVNQFAARIGGGWTTLGDNHVGNSVQCVAFSPDGRYLYVAGHFINLGDADGDGIARYDFVTGAWQSLGTGITGASQYIFAMRFDAAGNLYVGGSFTTCGGVACANIAKWDGANWSPLGSGTSNWVRDILIAPDGTVYVCGEFTTPYTYMAKWNGSTWSAIGTGNPDSYAYGLAMDKAGNLFLGGDFAHIGAVTTGFVAKFDGTNWSAVGDGTVFGNYVYRLAFAADGRLYASGQFQTMSGVTLNNVAVWNGVAWAPLGAGTYGPVYAMALDRDGLLYTAGLYVNGTDFNAYLNVWNGTSWAKVDIALPGSPNIYGLDAQNGNLAVGFDTLGTAIGSMLTAVNANNPGTAETYPVVTIQRSGGTSLALSSIINHTTGDALYFNYNLADGETLTIDLKPGHKTVTSNLYGNQISKLLGNSQFATFRFLPGSNNLAVLAVPGGSPTVTARVRSRVRHWSADGSA